ncbi:hypothetical protein [Nonlabens ulvanivorans]|uniref:hypothetical protein n=1 Tax=Nonlabens ulvanivorans TaxID=906888 RepID=UPI0029422D17|nr:hypothetical protein [Nonlabens ulvanivorans]WOI23606.1 hypothetical protein R1T42_03935 [Nonlabens ulvanivorans]
MKAKIFSHKQLIGTTEIQGHAGMGVLYGEFIPTEFYFDNIQKSVWEFWETNKPDYEKWHSLRFNAQLENGVFLYPEGGYTIDDLEEFPNEPKRIDIAGVAWEVINDFFLTQPTRPFVEEPWNELQIEQKIAFEDELHKEIGTKGHNFFDIFNKRKKHQLSGAEISAFCHDQRNDDVLFEIKNANLDKRFALVHLTWTGKKEKEGYPITTFYKDYDEFKYSKMYPNKVEWGN